MQAKGVGRVAARRGGECMAIAAGQGVLPPARPLGGGRLVEHVGVLGELGRVVAVGVAGAGVGAAGVFPLGLGGQAVAHAFALGQPAGQGLGIVPGDVDHGVVVALRKARLGPAVAGVAPLKGVATRRAGGVVLGVVAVAARAVGHGFGLVARQLQKPAELPHRDLVPPQVKRLADAHWVHRGFIGQGREACGAQQRKRQGQLARSLVAAHPEAACGHWHKLHAERVGQSCDRWLAGRRRRVVRDGCGGAGGTGPGQPTVKPPCDEALPEGVRGGHGVPG